MYAGILDTSFVPITFEDHKCVKSIEMIFLDFLGKKGPMRVLNGDGHVLFWIDHVLTCTDYEKSRFLL